MHGLKAPLCKGSCHGEAVTEGLLRKSSKIPDNFEKLQLIQSNASIYTREALLLSPAKPKKTGLSIS
jgi:hypothetical protein